MKTTSILIKPASSLCNSVCSYCFYDDVSNCRTVKSHGIIEPSVWQRLVDTALSSKEAYDHINFVFQGGEPLVAGLNFFKSFVSYVETHRQKTIISYALQTNGTLLNDEICEFLKENDFLVGISIDGFQANHDRNRFLRNSGSFNVVIEGLNCLKKHQIEFNVLTVLTKNLAKYPKELYQFYVDYKINYVQIIPCLADFDKQVKDDLYACTPELYQSFYKTFFSLWLDGFLNDHYISENLIDNILTLMSGYKPNRCGMLGECQSQCVVEANGSVYPCDFYVLDDYECGNIKTLDFDKVTDLLDSSPFLKETQSLPAPCQDCRYLKLCHGNCKRQRSSFVNESICGYQHLLKDVEAALPLILHKLSYK